MWESLGDVGFPQCSIGQKSSGGRGPKPESRRADSSGVVLEEVDNESSGVRGEAPAAKSFWGILLHRKHV